MTAAVFRRDVDGTISQIDIVRKLESEIKSAWKENEQAEKKTKKR
jgi:hypothetical protein